VVPDHRPAEAWARVAQAVVRRRVQLGLTQEEAAARARLSATTWRLVENEAQTRYRDLTLAGVERALGWAQGSIDAVLRGDEPTVAETRDPAPPRIDDDAVVRLRGKVARLSDEDARAVEALVDRLLADS
jgi:transcriptional regulator with XRE-family HTH domain